MSLSFSNSLQGLHHPGPMGHGTREPGRRGGGCCPGAQAPSQAPGVSGTPRFQTPGVAARCWCSQRRWWAVSRALGYREPQDGRLGKVRGGDATGPAGAVPDRLLSGRFSNPRQQPPLRRPRWAPATGGGPCIIGRAACQRVLIGRCASRPRSCARCRLHFVGRGRRRRWVRNGGGQQLVHRCSRALFVACLVSPWKGRGASTQSRSRRRCSLELEVAGLLSNLCAEETQMLASAPRLNSADRPMKTSVLRQRKGSVRKQHLLSWAWQQGRGQVLEILRSAKQTER